MRTLHLLNGDCALQEWRKCHIPGEVLVWRENYLHGAIPDTDDPEIFWRVRAEALHRLAPERPASEIRDELRRMHRTLWALTARDRLVLWLDCCPFDRALEDHVLALLSAMRSRPRTTLIRQDVVWDREAFEQYRDCGVPLDDAAVARRTGPGRLTPET